MCLEERVPSALMLIPSAPGARPVVHGKTKHGGGGGEDGANGRCPRDRAMQRPEAPPSPPPAQPWCKFRCDQSNTDPSGPFAGAQCARVDPARRLSTTAGSLENGAFSPIVSPGERVGTLALATPLPPVPQGTDVHQPGAHGQPPHLHLAASDWGHAVDPGGG